MRFDYTSLVSASPDTGDPIVIFRPEVWLSVHGPNGARDFLALVDTGADNTVFPASVAADLGILTIAGEGPSASAFGGQQIALSYADVELEVIHADATLRWSTQVYFIASANGDETLVLGHQGFLEFFTATFIGDEFALELEANSYLPVVE